jgi:hypothetical protein
MPGAIVRVVAPTIDVGAVREQKLCQGGFATQIVVVPLVVVYGLEQCHIEQSPHDAQVTAGVAGKASSLRRSRQVGLGRLVHRTRVVGLCWVGPIVDFGTCVQHQLNQRPVAGSDGGHEGLTGRRCVVKFATIAVAVTIDFGSIAANPIK